MIIKKLRAENLRNLSRVELEPHPALNYLYGDNGAGKTSLLESVVILSRGRSFRTSMASELIGSEGDTFRVFAVVEDSSGKQSRLGLERSGKRWRGRLDGVDLSQLSQLTRKLPVVLMEPDSHLLVSGPPESRRKYLDWGMFHVKHEFLDTWRRFSKALKQRNAALRRGREDVLDSIDRVLAEEGEALGALRQKHAESIASRIPAMLDSLSTRLRPIHFSYHEGWSSKSYLETLEEHRKKDLERGVTGSGPHRADLLFRCGKQNARAVLSRGEMKMFAAALILTQAQLLSEKGERPVLLFDDLFSEFDKGHFNSVLGRALEMNVQVWVSGTDLPSLEGPNHVFHVEQGRVEQVV